MSECSRCGYTKGHTPHCLNGYMERVEALDKELAFRTVQWEGVKDMLATEIAKREALEKAARAVLGLRNDYFSRCEGYDDAMDALAALLEKNDE